MLGVRGGHGGADRVSEFVELPWSADIALSDESVELIWQVAGIAPLGSLDQFARWAHSVSVFES